MELLLKFVSFSGTGAIVSAVATAAGREPIVMGKPSKMMFEVVQQTYPEVKPERTIMIGDRFENEQHFDLTYPKVYFLFMAEPTPIFCWERIAA